MPGQTIRYKRRLTRAAPDQIPFFERQRVGILAKFGNSNMHSNVQQGAGLNSSIAVIEEHRSTCYRWELYISVYNAHHASQSGRRRRRLRFQAKGLFHTSPGHSPWVRGPVFPSQAKGLLHRFEAVALEAA